MPLKADNSAPTIRSPDQSVEAAAGLIDGPDDGGVIPRPEEMERLWIEEGERRYQEFLAGGIEPIPADQALAEARARLRGG